MSELQDHRIVACETSVLACRYPRRIGKNARLGSHGEGLTAPIVHIRTDQGASGWGLLGRQTGEVSGLIGRKMADLFDPTVGVLDDRLLSLDFALHDLAGVILNLPVYQMLATATSQVPTPVVPCYDGAIYMDDLDPEDDPSGIATVLQNCADDYAQGHRAFKLKIGRGYRWSEARAGLERDIEVTHVVRDQYPECAILVDANDGYTARGFLDYFEAVADCDLFWIEEPFPETRDDLMLLRQTLRRHSARTLIADGEAHPDIPLLLDLAGEGLLDVLLMDVVGLGLTPWRRLMPELRKLGVAASPHAWGDPLKTLYAAQMAAGLGNIVTVEGVPGTSEAVDSSAYRLENGLLHVPDLPGWGLRPPKC
jgi:L-alanine-DL-glutamate epimerase-like enolase superfamily enzyme